MNPTKHTSGPWKAELVPSTLQNNNHFEVIADSPHMAGLRQTVCTINGPHKHENYKANAALIASAPDLLAALQALVQVCEAYDNGQKLPSAIVAATNQARAAIATATGGDK